MSENQIVQGVSIIAPPTDADEIQVRCDHCQEYLGSIVEVRGKLFVKYGHRLDYALHGICPTCYTPYHWTQTDEQLKRLMGRVGRK